MRGTGRVEPTATLFERHTSALEQRSQEALHALGGRDEAVEFRLLALRHGSPAFRRSDIRPEAIQQQLRFRNREARLLRVFDHRESIEDPRIVLAATVVSRLRRDEAGLLGVPERRGSYSGPTP